MYPSTVFLTLIYVSIGNVTGILITLESTVCVDYDIRTLQYIQNIVNRFLLSIGRMCNTAFSYMMSDLSEPCSDG